MGEHEENFIFEMGYNKGFKDGIKGSILKDQYEARLKADMVAMLTEIQLEIEEMDSGCGWEGYRPTAQVLEVIQQKINELEGKQDPTPQI